VLDPSMCIGIDTERIPNLSKHKNMQIEEGHGNRKKTYKLNYYTKY